MGFRDRSPLRVLAAKHKKMSACNKTIVLILLVVTPHRDYSLKRVH